MCVCVCVCVCVPQSVTAAATTTQLVLNGAHKYSGGDGDGANDLSHFLFFLDASHRCPELEAAWKGRRRRIAYGANLWYPAFIVEHCEFGAKKCAPKCGMRHLRSSHIETCRSESKQ